MKRLKVLVASGPTREPLDPVRFLSNRSSGTMGAELVRAARSRGHRVTWVQSPEMAETARDLLSRLKTLVPRHDAFFMATAVGDVRPVREASFKLKKSALRTVRFVPNPDVAREVSRRKKPGQVFVGFALESDRLAERGYEKLRSKNFDLIFVQRVTSKVNPFGERPVEAVVVDRCGCAADLGRLTKRRAAGTLVRHAEALHASKNA